MNLVMAGEEEIVNGRKNVDLGVANLGKIG